MGKLLRKLLHGIVPTWLYAVFKRPHASSRKLLHFRLRHGIHLMSNKSFSPTSPSSSSPLTTELVSLLLDVDQNTYYYSQSEDEEPHPITGSNKHTSSISIGSESQDEDDVHRHRVDDQLFPSRVGSTKENTGICAPMAAATIVKGSLHEDKHKPPTAINMGFTHDTSAARIMLQIQHDDDHQNVKGCQYDDGHCGLGRHDQHCRKYQHDDDDHHQPSTDGGRHANQHPQRHADDGPHAIQYPQHASQHPQHHADVGPHATQPPQHHADGGPPYHARHCHHDACNVHQHNHNCKVCGSHHRQLRAAKHDFAKKNRGSSPRQSLAMSAKKGDQDDNHHHRQHSTQDDKHHVHDTVDYQHPQPHPSGAKRKSMCLDEDDVGEDNQGGRHCSTRTWPCLKRQKGKTVRSCELPKRIGEMVGNGSAVVKYSYQDPQFAFWESMVEMILCNGLWGDVGRLEFLLHCYLALNDPNLHHAIHTSFLQVLKDLQSFSSVNSSK